MGGWANAGDRVARMASAHESPGSAWGGRHVHSVISDNPAGASADYVDQDSNPIINARGYNCSEAPRPAPSHPDAHAASRAGTTTTSTSSATSCSER